MPSASLRAQPVWDSWVGRGWGWRERMITSQQWIPPFCPLARYLCCLVQFPFPLPTDYAVFGRRARRKPSPSLSNSRAPPLASRTLLTRLAGIAKPQHPWARISTSPCLMIRAARLSPLPAGSSFAPSHISLIFPSTLPWPKYLALVTYRLQGSKNPNAALTLPLSADGLDAEPNPRRRSPTQGTMSLHHDDP